jgi:hypothetical protein
VYFGKSLLGSSKLLMGNHLSEQCLVQEKLLLVLPDFVFQQVELIRRLR